jgi:antitoxin YefM
VETISESRLGERFAEVLEGVAAGHGEVVVTREGGSVAIVPLAEFESLNETVYLFRSPSNARRLMSAMARLEGRDE